MKMSTMFGATLHTAPGRSESEGHQLLQRAAMLRQVGQGIFAYLPLGWRTIRKIEAVLRAELERVGGQEVSMPVVNPAELWKQTGRYFTIGPELARFRDRRGRDLVLAMTHEELVTFLGRSEIESYRHLPRMVFQLQTKFRDDPRPRAGLIRVREFVMKDAYSFDVDAAGLAARYRAQYQAYLTIFRRCGLPVAAVLSDVGMMGGSLAHEFVYLTPIGEDTLLICDSCGFAANREAATFGKPAPSTAPWAELAEIATPGATTIEALTAALGVPAAETAKAIFLAASREDRDQTVDTEFILAVVRGDMEANETKIGNLVQAAELRPMTVEEISKIGAVAGYGSPVGVTGVTVVVDELVAASTNLVAGANREGMHLRNVNVGRDFVADHTGDITAARAGDACAECGSELRTARGVEVGQIFKLGTRYSTALGAEYLDADGQRKPLTMGCYGIGVGRLLACLAEEHRDERGLRLPVTIAPYQVHLTLLDDLASAAGELARRVYDELWAAGVEVLFDDRDERAGVKFADADVIGLPLRVTIGRRSVANGAAEVRDRATGVTAQVPFDEVVAELVRRIAALRADIDATVVPVELPAEVFAP
ncbi:prolyl-tRNA synthetase [Salinispora tropica CNB-440]|uniref:Proline--tRNA ligase n=2 Tax=Salinispora tropica TaxID=168695 RepID=SYP_SALTO|nr:RecName: Full=Proline--tRNA ligase; AltName: Full=Prolyl-tRNA synthetase; Short=ProRS [Salinispora tropica CNB-440]ABP54256.1 prolyl-tRNA synthetase [Salinispora tropica CNB-440]